MNSGGKKPSPYEITTIGPSYEVTDTHRTTPDEDDVSEDGSCISVPFLGTASASGMSANHHQALFVDAEEMKAKVRASLLKPTYDVADFYWSKGVFQMIARNRCFENATLAVISANALWIAYDTDNNNAEVLTEADTQFQIAEHFFCTYFTFEWMVRFMSFKRKKNGLRDAWFVFDSALVFMMVAETWIVTIIMFFVGGSNGSSPMGNASILRLFRLLRLSRMARMLRSMPELMILIKGMVAAGRSVFFTLFLLIILLYIFAIAFTQLAKEDLPQYFQGIPRSMWSLLMHGTFLDNLGPVMEDIGRASIVYSFLFLCFIALAALMVMNMLIGVLCEVVSAVAATEKEDMSVSFVMQKMQSIITELDTDGDGNLSKREFIKILNNNEAVVALNEVGVDPVGLVDFVDHIFEDEQVELDFESFMNVVLQFRGSNTATVKDIMNLTKIVSGELKSILRVVDPDGSNKVVAPNPGLGDESPVVKRKYIENGPMKRATSTQSHQRQDDQRPYNFNSSAASPHSSSHVVELSYGATGDCLRLPPLPDGHEHVAAFSNSNAVSTGTAPVSEAVSRLGGTGCADGATLKVEAFLLAGMHELSKLQAQTASMPGIPAQSNPGTEQLQAWAAKMHQAISSGLDELGRMQ